MVAQMAEQDRLLVDHCEGSGFDSFSGFYETCYEAYNMYFDQLLGVVRTQKLVELLFSAVFQNTNNFQLSLCVTFIWENKYRTQVAI